MGPSNAGYKSVQGSKPKVGERGTHKFREYGYLPDGDPVSEVYLARITSLKNMASVVGLLQEDITMRVESRWDPFISTALLGKMNTVVQGVSGLLGNPKSLISKASTRRIWVGSTPITLSLKLKFEAINNPVRDVVEPCRILQSLALPSEPQTSEGEQAALNVELAGLKAAKGITGVIKAGGRVINALPILTPPGPSPFSWDGIVAPRAALSGSNITSTIEGLKGGDRIILQLGQFLRFDDIIVKEVSTAYHIKMDMYGDPVSAEATVIFETYEIPTVQSLEKAYGNLSMPHNSVELENGRREFHITSFG